MPTTDPELVELVEMLSKIMKRLEAIDPDAASIGWVKELKSLGVALMGTTGNLAQLKSRILADALEAGLEGIDSGADEGSEPHTRALLFALAEASDFVSLFAGWPVAFARLNATVQDDTITALKVNAAAVSFANQLDEYVQTDQLQALVGNPWGVQLVEPVQESVRTLKAALS